MSTFISEPGTRLAGRYRLEDRVSDMAGVAVWKAIDETLARPVAVLTFAPGFPRVYHVVTAARAASRMTDARLAQVFDVEDVGDRAYVVLEWVNGESLGDMLAAGPLESARAAGLVAEAAQALSAAHAAGLAHLCLTPSSLRWTHGGGVKITGLGVEAAMYGAYAENPTVADTQGLGRLLYAALTAHWPGNEPFWPTADSSFLPPAPLIDGELCSPRQVCAGVPSGIDAVTIQALAGRPYRGQPPLTSPAMLAEALARVAPSAQPAPPPVQMNRGRTGQGTARERDQAGRTARVATPSVAPPPTVRGPAPVRRALFGVVILLAAAAVSVGAWTLSRGLGKGAHPGSPPPSTHSAASAAPLTPVSAHGFDVYDLNPQDGNENDKLAALAIDNDPATAWHTDFYLNNPVFGRLKKGTGLILDMGRPVRLSTVEVTFGSTPGADAAIEVGNDNTLSPATLATFTTVAQANDIPGGTYTFHATVAATGRYVLIWFTSLPHEADGPANHYEAEIFNVAVRGTS